MVSKTFLNFSFSARASASALCRIREEESRSFSSASSSRAEATRRSVVSAPTINAENESSPTKNWLRSCRRMRDPPLAAKGPRSSCRPAPTRRHNTTLASAAPGTSNTSAEATNGGKMQKASGTSGLCASRREKKSTPAVAMMAAPRPLARSASRRESPGHPRDSVRSTAGASTNIPTESEANQTASEGANCSPSSVAWTPAPATAISEVEMAMAANSAITSRTRPRRRRGAAILESSAPASQHSAVSINA